MKLGDLIYDDEYKAFGIILSIRLESFTSDDRWLDVLYSWGVDEVVINKNDVSIKVINELG